MNHKRAKLAKNGNPKYLKITYTVKNSNAKKLLFRSIQYNKIMLIIAKMFETLTRYKMPKNY